MWVVGRCFIGMTILVDEGGISYCTVRTTVRLDRMYPTGVDIFLFLRVG